MKSPKKWTRSELDRHLQHALDLELWTIPLYLTSLYSIKGLTTLRPKDYPPSAKLIFSVVVQEMLHVELVCNISNALGYSPQFNLPTYNPSLGIPFIHPHTDKMPKEIRDYEVRLHPLGKEALQLFCAIELPHPKQEIIWEEQDEYHSIADLYDALRIGVSTLWDSCYVGHEQNVKQKDNFKEYHNQQGHGLSILIDSAEQALNAIEAIVEQGEGADAEHVASDFRPPEYHRNGDSDIAWYKGDLSHYQKFKILLHSYDKLPEVYEIYPTDESISKNETLKKEFKEVWDIMQASFNTVGDDMQNPFWQSMSVLGVSLAEVWKTGMCPDLNLA
jgi:Ferritin-like